MYLLDLGVTLTRVAKTKISRVKVDPNQVMTVEPMCYKFSFGKFDKRNVWVEDPIIRKREWKKRMSECVIPVQLFPQVNLGDARASGFWNGNPDFQRKQYSVARIASHFTDKDGVVQYYVQFTNYPNSDFDLFYSEDDLHRYNMATFLRQYKKDKKIK